MKVLFVDQFSVMGGAQLCLLDVLDAIKRRGWEAQVALPGDGPMLGTIRARGIPVEAIPCGQYRSSSKSLGDFLRLPSDVWRQKRILKTLLIRGEFDLIYVNGPRLLAAAALAARDLAPVLFHAHNRIHQSYASALVGWAIRRSKATVIACSKYVAEPLGHHLLNGKLHVIPNGTPDAGFKQRAFGPGRSWRIGMIARISPEKGQVEFLEAIALLASEFPGTKFVICGAATTPSSRYLDQVSHYARGLPVDFLGWRDDVSAVLAGLDLLVVPSQDEGMPRIVLEAFSAGVPVVAFATGGIPELITHRETGFLVKELTPEALASQIREVITSDAGTIQRLAANARERWERLYTAAMYQSRIMDLIEQVVSSCRARRETAPQRARK